MPVREYHSQQYHGQGRGGLIIVLTLLLFGIIGSVLFLSSHMATPAAPAVNPPDDARIFLQEGAGRIAPAFAPSQIPRWLYLHMGIIASLQVLALIWAAGHAGRERLTRRDARIVLFLCEVPMYLGLFGTLLGVCLTQFISGSLVAPLAYCTTMSGVLLHVIGKLGIWLRLPEELIDAE